MIIEFYYTPDGLEPPSDVSIDFSDSSDEFNPFATRYLMKTLHLETPSYIDGDLCELVFSCSVIDGSIIEWDSRHQNDLDTHIYKNGFVSDKLTQIGNNIGKNILLSKDMKTEYADIIANSFTFGRVYDNIHIIVKAMSDIYSYTGRFSLIIETVGFNGIHKTRNELTKTWTSYMIYSHALTGG